MKPHPSPLPCSLTGLGVLCGTILLQAFIPDQETRLEVQGLVSYAGYGSHVAVSGDRAVAGAGGAMVNGMRSGAAYVFVRENGVWSAEAELTPDDPVSGSQFGYAVDISGDTIVVGAYGDPQYGVHSGAAYVFVRGENGWVQRAKLTPGDTRAWLQFGDPVAIDGDRLVIGALGDSSLASHSGAAYVFVRQNEDWLQEAKLKAAIPRASASFGFSLAIQGDTIGVGAPFSNFGTSVYAGNVCVFERIDGVWIQTAELWGAHPASYRFLGWSIGLSRSSLVAGAPMASGSVPGSGVVYLFDRDDTGWNPVTTLEADDTVGGDLFGMSVVIQEDLLVVGAAQDSSFATQSGSVYLFARHGTAWNQTMELSAHDIAPGDYFGYALGLDGRVLAVGAPFKAGANTVAAGAAYVFTAPPPNTAPVADASATVDRVIAAADSAWVTLDGSNSYDPDDDPLGFEWYLDGTWLAYGAVATVQLGIGTHLITLHVSDGTLTASDVVTVEVISAGDAMRSLADQVAQAAIPQSQSTALSKMLQSAADASDRGRLTQALQHLSVFQNHLRALAGRQIATDIAQDLHLQAQVIADALN